MQKRSMVCLQTIVFLKISSEITLPPFQHTLTWWLKRYDAKQLLFYVQNIIVNLESGAFFLEKFKSRHMTKNLLVGLIFYKMFSWLPWCKTIIRFVFILYMACEHCSIVWLCNLLLKIIYLMWSCFNSSSIPVGRWWSLCFSSWHVQERHNKRGKPFRQA